MIYRSKEKPIINDTTMSYVIDISKGVLANTPYDTQKISGHSHILYDQYKIFLRNTQISG